LGSITAHTKRCPSTDKGQGLCQQNGAKREASWLQPGELLSKIHLATYPGRQDSLHSNSRIGHPVC